VEECSYILNFTVEVEPGNLFPTPAIPPLEEEFRTVFLYSISQKFWYSLFAHT